MYTKYRILALTLPVNNKILLQILTNKNSNEQSNKLFTDHSNSHLQKKLCEHMEYSQHN